MLCESRALVVDGQRAAPVGQCPVIDDGKTSRNRQQIGALLHAIEENGFTALKPGWPDDPETVEEANAHVRGDIRLTLHGGRAVVALPAARPSSAAGRQRMRLSLHPRRRTTVAHRLPSQSAAAAATRRASATDATAAVTEFQMSLPGYPSWTERQLVVADLGHEDPTLLLSLGSTT